MLLAARRQEGLRQVILESVDEARPEAFKRMIRLVLDHGLDRFSSVVRAVDVWFGFQWESKDRKTIDLLLEEALQYLETQSKRTDAIEHGHGESACLDLWAEAFCDVMRALPRAASMPSVSVDDATVGLAIDESGAPRVVVEKNGQALKAVPAKLKKNKEIKEIRRRAADLKRQSSRMRKSLEQSMCRGDIFTAEDLKSFENHPLLAPFTGKLLFTTGDKTGYPSGKDCSLLDLSGNRIELEKGERLRIAHPCDLAKTGNWSKWQEECFASRRVQPFKQIFRELYVLTESEKKEGHASRRYEGHQVQPKRTAALLGARGWVLGPAPRGGSGKDVPRRKDHRVAVVSGRRFHACGGRGAGLVPTSASVVTQKPRSSHGFRVSARSARNDGVGWPTLKPSPEGPTVESVHFTKPGDWRPLNLVDIPALVFSEVMRDVDLVVSVAHAGGVDPEASASTVEMRAALAKEICSLLGFENVRSEGSHVLIDGKLSGYSVHLGSAVVHRMPGGQLFIVPVHFQHR